LSYDEATELAYFGAKVVHPSTMAPAIADQIPIWIRNTFNPEHPGTVIHTRNSPHKKTGAERGPVTGFSTIDRIALINLEGTGMVGVPGVAERLFGAIRSVGVSVIMISQASSEHSICFVVPEPQAELAKKTVEKTFFAELHHGQIEKVEVLTDCSILAAVGDVMVEHPGVAGKFFGALGKAGVNIRAIAQGSSERNISTVIARTDAVRALRAVHAAFTLSSTTLSLGLIGPGLIGSTFLDQWAREAARLKRHHGIDLRVRGILSSSRMVLSEGGLSPESWKREFEEKSVPSDLEAFIRHIHADHIPHAVILDCTSSAELSSAYPSWMERGLHVITPNKKGNTGTQQNYQRARTTSRRHARHYLYETTVGAGLPIIQTVRDLVQTGDRVRRVEGVLSGTLSFLFNTWDGAKPFSEIVLEARSLGYTEPDPRDDLSGMDVARKLVILAREMGLELELTDVKVEGLVPVSLQSGTIEDYLKRLPEQDAAMQALLMDAKAKGQVLRYVGVIENLKGEAPRVSVSLQRFAASHAFGRLSGSDNCVAFVTDRYHSQPLVVQGPGAGPEVTAAGVFADLLKLSSYLGAVLG
jgi:aspartokinase/homoserine dehydrogenase 1